MARFFVASTAYVDRETAAAELEVSVQQISRLVRRGRLEVRRIGRTILVSERSVRRYARERASCGPLAVVGGRPAAVRLGCWPPAWMQEGK